MKEFNDISPMTARVDPDTLKRAVLKVCSMARDFDDAKTVLSVLGILPKKVEEDVPTSQPNESRGVCRNGHPRSDNNTKIRKGGITRCMDCHRESSRRYREKQRLSGTTGSRRRKACSKGHLWKPETTSIKTNGQRMCMICWRERQNLTEESS